MKTETKKLIISSKDLLEGSMVTLDTLQSLNIEMKSIGPQMEFAAAAVTFLSRSIDSFMDYLQEEESSEETEFIINALASMQKEVKRLKGMHDAKV